MIKLLLILFSKFINLIPQKLFLALGKSIGLFWFYILRFRRGIVRENLQKILKRNALSSQLDQITRENFIHYGITILEIVKSLSWTKDDYLKNTILDGQENLEKAVKEKTGAFLLVPHTGNWEFGIGTITSRNFPLDAVVKKTKNRKTQNFLEWYRKIQINVDFPIENLK
jgi:lauroyl/myristoyl acyltransferase